MTTTVASMLDRLRQAEDHLVALATNLRNRREKLSNDVEKRLLVLGDVEILRERQAMELMGARVGAALSARQYDALSLREAKFAMRLWDRHVPAVMAEVMRIQPLAQKALVNDCLGRWEDLDTLPVGYRDGYTRLLMDAVKEPGPLSTVPTEVAAVGLDGPKRLADALGDKRSLLETFEVLRTRLGLKPSWAYTAQVLAHSAAKTPRKVREHWNVVRAEPRIEALLLPEGPDRTSWFSSAKLPLVQPSLRARVVFLATLLRSPEFDADARGVLLEQLLRSSFKDPRLPPESLGWQRLRQYAPDCYADVLEQLVREDLTLFFEHAMHEPARGKFWLGYLSAIRRTVCVLGSTFARDLERRLAGSPPEVKAAMKRVRTFSSPMGVSAFCLYFDDVVVVEFSDTGNAAYVYGRREFDDRFNASLMANRLRAPSDLKDRSRAKKKIIHQSGWERDARELLAGLGIRQGDAARPAAPIRVAPSAVNPPTRPLSPIAPTPLRSLADEGNRTSAIPHKGRAAVVHRLGSWVSMCADIARGAGLEVIGDTVVRGTVWIVGEPSLGSWLESHGIQATFVAEGSKGTGGRPAWRVDQ